ncbi:MAG TPA: CPBP family intramembrane glutamic endopeptidase, partial [Actinomycetota bacterium]|nr:CPBP family intramembrane glutamic endopeptidase [Actinomycetota bacterium]
EVLFRGIIFRIMEEGIGSWGAIALSSLIFGGAHLSNPHSSVFAAIAIAVEAGLMLSGAYMLTRDLWMAIGIHWSWNFFEGPVFGTAVSGGDFPVMVRSTMTGPALWTGGSFGPEAGLVAFIIAGSIGGLMIYLAVKKGFTLSPMWRAKEVSPEQT